MKVTRILVLDTRVVSKFQRVFREANIIVDNVDLVGETALPTYTDPDLEAERASCGTSECRYSHGSHRGPKVWGDSTYAYSK